MHVWVFRMVESIVWLVCMYGCLEWLKVCLSQDIPAFVMYYVYGVPRSSPLIESFNSDNLQWYNLYKLTMS